MTTIEDTITTTTGADAFAERVFAAALGTLETFSIYVGDRMGWYRSLLENGPATPAALAGRTATSERYVREWLEQQAAIGILTAEGAGEDRFYTLPPGAAEVLTDENSLSYLAPLARMPIASATQMPALLEAYRTGGGVSWEQLGTDARMSQADMNRPWFEHALAGALAGVPDLHERLGRPGVRIADIGSGAGWSSIALARAYPRAEIDGYDVDGPSIELARENARATGVADRVRFHAADADAIAEHGRYDVVFAFECIHDMPRPVEVLAAARTALTADGVTVVMDEAVGDAFEAPANAVEQIMYGLSLFVCLPDGMSHRPSVGTGTVMRPDTLRAYAEAAGFSAVSVLQIEDFGFWRFYCLEP